MRSIYAVEHKLKKDGDKSAKKFPKRNRSGNILTIGLQKALDILMSASVDPLPAEVAENIVLLIEIRDNSLHFHNSHLGFSMKVQEVGTASLRNFVNLSRNWFECDLSKFNFYLMPMSFHHEADVMESFSVQPLNKQLSNLVAYLARVEKQFPSDVDRDYNIALRIETRFVKSASTEAIKVQFTKDPTAPQITITEEESLRRFPLDYNDLTEHLKARYSDFRANNTYHKQRCNLERQERLCRVRLLDPDKPKGLKKKFYSSELIKEFDELYTKR